MQKLAANLRVSEREKPVVIINVRPNQETRIDDEGRVEDWKDRGQLPLNLYSRNYLPGSPYYSKEKTTTRLAILCLHLLTSSCACATR